MLNISSIAVAPLPPQAPTVKVQPVVPVKPSNTVSPENVGVSVVVSPGGDGARAEPVYRPSAMPPVNPTGEAATVRVRNNGAAPERVGEVAASAVAAVAVNRAAATEGAPDAEAINPVREAAQTQAQDNQQRVEDEQADPSVQARAQAEAQAQAQAEALRFKGELPREVKSPAREALDLQINELLPNMWKASRAAVDVLIGEEARAAAAARAEVLAPQPEVPSERAIEATDTYVRTAGGDVQSPGSNVDKLI